MSLDFSVSDTFPVSSEVIYNAWLSSEEHSKMTGSPANVSNVAGGEFTAWDGYIQGKNLELSHSSRILQRWRTTDFEDTEEDSLLEILFEPEGDSTRVTINHSSLPEHGLQYKQGWFDAYFTPMKRYFNW
jgi:activator of HSP90 ATPase